MLNQFDQNLSQNEFDISSQDAITWLHSLSSESVDLVITDPPYESLEKHRKIGTTTRLKNSKSSSNQWFEIFPNERFEELLIEIYRVLRKNSHFYLFCDQETMFIVKPIAEKVGFKFWKPIVWDKVNIGMGYHYRARYEFILFFEKGKRKLNNLGTPDIIVQKKIRGGYPTEKPVQLAEVLISQSSVEGNTVIDPFCGAGFVGVASELLLRNFRGNDINEEAVKITKARMQEVREQHEIPKLISF
ncbi:DNA modification methylase [Rheinheimera sp. A13L]|uniref:DNA-methyltransferase n=1 Tax=Rheinheimera sp. A13L TaxID=506534 RepID=UPI0002124D5E|nr:site-specific DNA-methyltransferase [Rheinheimera sp. A13L]EGM78371.1 DNA modification methylase [Rheinheimera sp. A13L]